MQESALKWKKMTKELGSSMFFMFFNVIIISSSLVIFPKLFQVFQFRTVLLSWPSLSARVLPAQTCDIDSRSTEVFWMFVLMSWIADYVNTNKIKRQIQRSQDNTKKLTRLLLQFQTFHRRCYGFSSLLQFLLQQLIWSGNIFLLFLLCTF